MARKKKKMPACMRTGHCCSRLNSPGTIGFIDNLLERLTRKELRKGNYTKKFIRAWKTGAEKAVAEDRGQFRCPLLEGTNTCTVHNKKPAVCADSLNHERLMDDHVTFNSDRYYHQECGYLEGPKAIRKTVELARVANTLPLSDKEGRAAAHDKSWKYHSRYINSDKFCYKYDPEKGWYKAPKPKEEQVELLHEIDEGDYEKEIRDNN